MNVKKLCEDPLICEIENFLSKAECEKLINSTNQHMDESNINFGQKDKTYRQSKSININDDELEMKVTATVNELLKSNFFPNQEIQITKYSIGGFYKEHFDAFLDHQEDGRKQRLISAIIYLNDNFNGGETTFDRLKFSIPPRTGKLIIFKNCIGDTNYIHPNSLHSSEEITKGQKFVATLWLRNNFKTQDSP